MKETELATMQNKSLCEKDLSETSIKKTKRGRKSTSHLVELNNLNILKKDQTENNITTQKKSLRSRTVSKKENIDTTQTKPAEKPLNVKKMSTDEVKLEPISVNTLDKRRKSTATESQPSKSEQPAEPAPNTTLSTTSTNKKQTADTTSKLNKSVSSDSDSDSEDQLEIEDEPEILETLDLEYLKLEENIQVTNREYACLICEFTGATMVCQGTCQKTYHHDCLGFVTRNNSFTCEECTSGVHICIVCNKAHHGVSSAKAQKCQKSNCGKYFHDECAQKSHLFRKEISKTSKNSSLFICPGHSCLSCEHELKFGMIESKEAVVKGHFVTCIRCSISYHGGDFCMAAGSIVLDSCNIICANHINQEIVKPKAKFKSKNTDRVNVSWCFLCCNLENLIECTTCPSSYHLECIQKHTKIIKKIPEITTNQKQTTENAEKTQQKQSPDDIIDGVPVSEWRCEDCINDRHPLYGDIVWAKVGIYRWWPAQVCHPRNLPPKVRSKNFQVGQFCVKFFGTNDYYWLGLFRAFWFALGDQFTAGCGSNKLGVAYKDGVIDAIVGFREIRRIKLERSSKFAKETIRQTFSFIKVNRPFGNVRMPKILLDDIPQCECKPESLCSTEDCVNKVLHYECHPSLCISGERCQNQRFVKRQYPKQETFKCGNRGYGLKTLEDIKKGQFVNEYVGELIDDEECKRRLKWANENKITDFYLMTIEKDRVIDAGPKGNLSRYMNHSCDPNCKTEMWMVNCDVRVGLFAINDIPAGAELTFNYNFDCLSNEKTVCRCGSKNCSGYLGKRPKNVTEPKPATNTKKRKQERISLDADILPNAKKMKNQKNRSNTVAAPVNVEKVSKLSSINLDSFDDTSTASSSPSIKKETQKRKSKAD